MKNALGGFSPVPAASVLGSGTLPFVLGASYATGSYASASYGAPVATTSNTSVTTWAKVEQLTAKEVLENGKLTYKQPYRITIRYTNTITNVDQVEWKGITIVINSITQDARQTEKILFGYGGS